ncbi:MAG: rhodanese-like domain-containing protein [Burkholderiales bacterium]
MASAEGPSAGAAGDKPALPVGTMLVDVRGAGEFDSGHIEGAVSLPLDRIHVDIARAVPDQKMPLVLYCRSGARSGRACNVLTEMGYDQVTNGGGIGSLALRLNRRITARR